MARNTANSIMALKPLTHHVGVAVLVNGVDRTDFIKIKKDYKKCLTEKRKYDIINTESEVNRMKEITRYRIDFLKQMDTYVREVIGDDDITIDIWFAGGVPDGYNEQDLIDIAKDNVLWLDTVNCFAKCCKLGLTN